MAAPAWRGDQSMRRARATFGPTLLPRVAGWAGVLALVCAALPVGALAQSLAPVTVQRISVVEEAGAVEIAIEATGPVGYRTMALSDPARYVIDLPAAKNGIAWATHQVGLGAIQAVRVGQVTETPPVTRIVIDLAQPLEWSVRRPSAQTVVARFTVPEAHGATASPWSDGAPASNPSAPERPSGARPADVPPAARSGASAPASGDSSRLPAGSVRA